MTDPAVAVLPYGQTLGPHLARVPVDDLVWPLGRPERLNGLTVAQLEPSDHLIVSPKTRMHTQLRWGTKARVSLLMGEPSVIHARHLALLRFSYWRFYRVLTFSEVLLSRIPNGVFFPFGGTWVPQWRDLRPEKTRMTSLIASAKRDTTGHRLRHEVADWVRQTGRDVDIMGRGYTPFEVKADGLAPYRFSVVIENVREQNYFSEKLVDAVLCQTVPIYWGCPNLDRFFDPGPIIRCESFDDIQSAVDMASEADYAERLPALQALAAPVAAYGDIETRAARAVLDAHQ